MDEHSQYEIPVKEQNRAQPVTTECGNCKHDVDQHYARGHRLHCLGGTDPTPINFVKQCTCNGFVNQY